MSNQNAELSLNQDSGQTVEPVQVLQRQGSQLIPLPLGGSTEAMAQLASQMVKTTGDQTIAGQKIFTTAPQVPTVVEKPEPNAQGELYTDQMLEAMGEDKRPYAANVGLVKDVVDVLATEVANSFVGLFDFVTPPLTEAQTDAAAAKTLAEAALPKAGGTLTGNITIQNPAYDFDAPGQADNRTGVDFSDKNGASFGGLLAFDNRDAVSTGCRSLALRLYTNKNIESNSHALALDVGKDGTPFATSPHPRTNNYNNDIVTMKSFKDLTVVYPDSTNMYLGGTGASDTADLNVGRGFSPEKPFASFKALTTFLANKITEQLKTINIVFQSDITENDYMYLRLKNIGCIKFSGNGHTLTHRTIGLYNGEYWFDNLNMTLHSTGDGRYSFIYGASYAHIVLAGDMVFTGAPTTGGIWLDKFCYLSLYNNSVSVTGNVTGKRYQVNTTSQINVNGKGPNFFPGSVEGNVAPGGSYV